MDSVLISVYMSAVIFWRFSQNILKQHINKTETLALLLLRAGAKVTSIARAMRLSWLENVRFYGRVILTSKVGQTDLVSRIRSRFVSGSVHGRLQVSVCIGYDLCYPS